MLLFLDTSDLKKVKFALIAEKAIKTKTISIPYEENFKTLEHLDNFLNRNKTKIENLNSIIICSGPGSFTGLRVGAALAQAFSFSHNITFSTIKKTRLPKNLKELLKLKKKASFEIDYGRPAIY
jgi:tRNA threonylcarbamoyladenosine biosynthesis protein TsaB